MRGETVGMFACMLTGCGPPSFLRGARDKGDRAVGGCTLLCCCAAAAVASYHGERRRRRIRREHGGAPDVANVSPAPLAHAQCARPQTLTSPAMLGRAWHRWPS
eukprot:365253-Chlamydomonas_euryale.AAC.31